MSSPAGPAENSLVERLKGRALDLYFRTDWQAFFILLTIAMGVVGMFFVIVAIGEYRMNR